MSDLMKHGRKPNGNKVYDAVLLIFELEKTISNHFLYFQKESPSPQSPLATDFLKEWYEIYFLLQSSRLLRVIQVIKYACGRLRTSPMSQASMKIVSFSLWSLCNGVMLFSSIQENSLLLRVVLIYFHCINKCFYYFKNLVLDKNKTYAVTQST